MCVLIPNYTRYAFMEIGLYLRKLRISRNYSQQFVANYLKISRNAYGEWESGKTDIALNKLEQLVKLYQIGLKDFLVNYEKQKKEYLIKTGK